MRNNIDKINEMVVAGPSYCNGVDSSGKCRRTGALTTTTTTFTAPTTSGPYGLPYPKPDPSRVSKATTKAGKFLFWMLSFRKPKISN